jgi:hypothetical protein
MKIMANHGSATTREEAPHENGSNINTLKLNSKIESLTEMICGAGDESAAALLVLMAMLENADDPETLVHAVKHLAFTRCGELNVHGMVDAQIAMLEDKLFASNALVS